MPAKTDHPITPDGDAIEAIDRALEIGRSERAPLPIMQCASGYPPLLEELNSNVIAMLRDHYLEVAIGCSGRDSRIHPARQIFP